MRVWPGLGDDESGSVALLSLGYAVLALLLVFVCVDASSLHLSQKRVEAAADAAALAGADGFTLGVADGVPTAWLTSAGVWEQAAGVVAAYPGMQLREARTDDGVSARVRVTTLWRAPISGFLVPDGVELSAAATSRTALR